jgi:hypothetical protein
MINNVISNGTVNILISYIYKEIFIGSVINKYRSKMKQRKKIEYTNYDNSKYLDINMHSQSKEFIEMIKHIFNQSKSNNNNKTQLSLNILLSNLYSNFHDKNKYTSYHRSQSGKYGEQRYNPFKIGRRSLVTASNILIELNYVDHTNGFYDRTKSYKSRTARMKATTKLIKLMEHDFNINIDMIVLHQDAEVIILKDENKHIIDYEDKGYINLMRRKVHLYNDLLSEKDITFDWIYVDDKYREQIHLKKVHRVFNMSSWSKGGRYTGAFWMQTSKEAKKHILIDNERTVELDYGAYHINMLYALKGVNYNGCAYKIPNYDFEVTPKLRSCIKKLILTAINSDSDKSAVESMKNELVNNREDYPDSNSIPDFYKLLEDFKDHHKPISDCLCNGYGRKLQNLDSKVCEYIIYKMTIKGIPVLSVHDSFICQKRHEEELSQLMDEAYIHQFCKKFPDVKPPSITREEADLENLTPFAKRVKPFKEFDFTPLNFTQHKGSTLPYILFTDPDFFCYSSGQLGKLGRKKEMRKLRIPFARYKKEAKELWKRAQNIRIPSHSAQLPMVAEYNINPATSEFLSLRIIPLDEMDTTDEFARYTDNIDLTMVSAIESNDKNGNQEMLSVVKELLFGDKNIELTDSFCQDFFNEVANFDFEKNIMATYDQHIMDASTLIDEPDTDQPEPPPVFFEENSSTLGVSGLNIM